MSEDPYKTIRFESRLNLRPGFGVILVHPRDLTQKEAERLKQWIDLLVIPEEQPSAGALGEREDGK